MSLLRQKYISFPSSSKFAIPRSCQEKKPCCCYVHYNMSRLKIYLFIFALRSLRIGHKWKYIRFYFNQRCFTLTYQISLYRHFIHYNVAEKYLKNNKMKYSWKVTTTFTPGLSRAKQYFSVFLYSGSLMFP